MVVEPVGAALEVRSASRDSRDDAARVCDWVIARRRISCNVKAADDIVVLERKQLFAIDSCRAMRGWAPARAFEDHLCCRVEPLRTEGFSRRLLR